MRAAKQTQKRGTTAGRNVSSKRTIPKRPVGVQVATVTQTVPSVKEVNDTIVALASKGSNSTKPMGKINVPWKSLTQEGTAAFSLFSADFLATAKKPAPGQEEQQRRGPRNTPISAGTTLQRVQTPPLAPSGQKRRKKKAKTNLFPTQPAPTPAPAIHEQSKKDKNKDKNKEEKGKGQEEKDKEKDKDKGEEIAGNETGQEEKDKEKDKKENEKEKEKEIEDIKERDSQGQQHGQMQGEFEIPGSKQGVERGHAQEERLGENSISVHTNKEEELADHEAQAQAQPVTPLTILPATRGLEAQAGAPTHMSEQVQGLVRELVVGELERHLAPLRQRIAELEDALKVSQQQTRDATQQIGALRVVLTQLRDTLSSCRVLD